MKDKRNKTTDKPKRVMVEASEEVQKYYESYPGKERITLEQALEISREEAKVLVK